jgi:hypothetical protein
MAKAGKYGCARQTLHRSRDIAELNVTHREHRTVNEQGFIVATSHRLRGEADGPSTTYMTFCRCRRRNAAGTFTTPVGLRS